MFCKRIFLLCIRQGPQSPLPLPLPLPMKGKIAAPLGARCLRQTGASPSAGNHRPDGPETDHALAINPDHPMGAVQSVSTIWQTELGQVVCAELGRVPMVAGSKSPRLASEYLSAHWTGADRRGARCLSGLAGLEILRGSAFCSETGWAAEPPFLQPRAQAGGFCQTFGKVGPEQTVYHARAVEPGGGVSACDMGAEGGDDLFVDGAFERDDGGNHVCGADPFPPGKLRMFAVDADGVLGAVKAH